METENATHQLLARYNGQLVIYDGIVPGAECRRGCHDQGAAQFYRATLEATPDFPRTIRTVCQACGAVKDTPDAHIGAPQG